MTEATGRRRVGEIDAIRGWAALSVACFHIFWETFGIVVPWLRSPMMAGLLAGHFDVILFFILSGDALSHPFFCGGGNAYLTQAALKRYLRLTVPIILVATVTMSIMFFGLNHNVAAAVIVKRPDWLGSFANFHPGGGSLFRYALYYVYAGDYRANYLPFLWTMPIEFLGSLVLFLVLFLWPNVRRAEWLILGAAVVLIRSDAYVGCFLIGVLLSRMRALGLFDVMGRGVVRFVSPVVTILALAAAGYFQETGEMALLPQATGATALLVGIYANPPLVRFLARDPLSQFLGRISYLLYLWHFVILISLTSWLIVSFAQDDALGTGAALSIGVATLGVSILVSALTMPIETLGRRANVWLLAVLDPKTR